MKIDDVRCYPRQDYRLVSMLFKGNTYSYFHSKEGTEIFEVYFNKEGRPELGHYYSNAYRMHEGKMPPKKYAAELTFLKEEFNKIDWDTLEVTTIMSQ